MSATATAAERSDRARNLHKRIFSFCASSESVYAVLDGASIPGLIDRLAEHKPKYTSLYAGVLDPELTVCAPYLVAMEPKCEFTWLMLEEGWGKHWGIFAVSDSDMAAMRRHIRTLLRVKDPEGKIMYFRFYDPRALRAFLPTCNGNELAAMFGPITSYIAEDADATTALRFHIAPGEPGWFRRGDDVLATERLSLEASSAQ